MTADPGTGTGTGQVSPVLADPGRAAGAPSDGLAPLDGLALSRGEVDRAGLFREDADWLAAAWADPRSRVVVVRDGQARVRDGACGVELILVPPAEAPEGLRFLLGTDTGGVAYLGVAILDGPAPSLPGSQAAEGGAGDATAPGAARWTGLRQVGALLSARDAGLMTHAVALANWHAQAGYCPRCGAATEPAAAGSSRRCVSDGAEQFPRSDPAVIMLVTDPDDRALLARNAQWPPGRVSILAGFVEPGESAEQAVAREVLEETGLVVGQIRYVGSQPWPMPHSLMLGFRAHADGAQQIQVDAHEIAEAAWFSRTGLRDAVERGEIKLPPPVSIAHHIIASWYGGELAADW
jgi:NAD+ diphosphatase